MLPIELSPAAQIDFDDAADWYGSYSDELRITFIAAIDAALELVRRSPASFPVVSGTQVRRAIVRKFPYIILFTLQSDHIFIYSIFHTSRNPIVWRGRVG